MILAGDIGGTKCNFALIELRDRDSGVGYEVLLREHYASRSYPDFAAVLEKFLSDARGTIAKSSAGKLLGAGLGVAGPVLGEAAHLTNLGWNLNRAAIQKQLGITRVALLNDLEATGYSLAWLQPEEMLILNAGKPAPKGTCALIAAGTGLGEAVLRWNGSRYIVEPSEGGHCDLAPRTDREIALLTHMKKATPGPISFELVLSGRGFLTIHQFLDPSVSHPGFEESATAAPVITEHALDGSCPVCVETLDVWTALYGAEAGNLALKALARGGVFVAGGIAPKILAKMKDGTFMRAFAEKESFQEMLSQIPIHMVLNEEAPLLGSAAEAARLLES